LVVFGAEILITQLKVPAPNGALTETVVLAEAPGSKEPLAGVVLHHVWLAAAVQFKAACPVLRIVKVCPFGALPLITPLKVKLYPESAIVAESGAVTLYETAAF